MYVPWNYGSTFYSRASIVCPASSCPVSTFPHKLAYFLAKGHDQQPRVGPSWVAWFLRTASRCRRTL